MIKISTNQFKNKVVTIDKDFLHYSVEIVKPVQGIIITNHTNNLQVSVLNEELKSIDPNSKKINLDSFIKLAKSDKALAIFNEIDLTATKSGLERLIQNLPDSFYK